MIEIRELIIKAVVTKSAGHDKDPLEKAGKGKPAKGTGSDELDQLMEVLKDQNER